MRRMRKVKMASTEIRQRDRAGRAGTLLLAVVAVMLTACVDGFIRVPADGAREEGNGSGDDGVAEGTASKQGFLCADPVPPPVATEMKRMTRRELGLVVTDIFGATVARAVAAQISLYPSDTLTDPAETYVSDHTREHVTAAFHVADGLGTALAADRTPLKSFADDCITAQTPTTACVKKLIQRLGAQVFRRPLTSGSADAEVEQLVAIFSSEKIPADGLKLLISRIMLAPDFWFHLEAGGAMGPQGVKLTPYEVASRISFGVTGSMPDAELFAAAQNNQLSTREQVRQHVQRLMQTPRGKAHVLEFFSNWLTLDHFPDLSQLKAYLNGIESEGLSNEVVEELHDFIEHVVFSARGRFSDLFVNAAMFAKSDRLAGIYQTQKWSQGSPPNRSSGPYKGIILRGNFLLTEGEDPSPILRGVFLRRRILCETIAAPSNDLIAQRPSEPPDPLMFSNRMRTHLITANQPCSSCHNRINPIGFVFENFDSLGRWRKVENVYSENGSVIGQHSIDTRVAIEGVSPKQPLVTSSPEELNAELSQNESATACLSRRLFRHTNLRLEKTSDAADNCQLHNLHEKLKNSTLFDFFVESVANDSIFTKSM